MRFSLMRTSRPIAAKAARVNLSASAPKRSISDNGIDEIPLGLAHLLPVLVADQARAGKPYGNGTSPR